MITNTNQKVDQDKYGEEFDRIFRYQEIPSWKRPRKSGENSLYRYIKHKSWKEKLKNDGGISHLVDKYFTFTKFCRGKYLDNQSKL